MPSGQYPAFFAGQIITAALLQSLAPLNAYKAGDTPRATNTTLANDPDLSIPVAASAVYFLICYLDYEGGTLGSSDIKVQWNAPAGATLRYQAFGTNTSGAVASQGTRTQGTANAFGTAGAGNLQGLTMWGTLFMSTTPGSFVLQWAQNTSNGTATIVHAQSAMILLRLA